MAKWAQKSLATLLKISNNKKKTDKVSCNSYFDLNFAKMPRRCRRKRCTKEIEYEVLTPELMALMAAIIEKWGHPTFSDDEESDDGLARYVHVIY